MRNGDKCCLLVYGPDGRQKGIIALSLRGQNPGEGVDDAKSIGALPYSVPNEGRIRFTVLEMVDQADVPTWFIHHQLDLILWTKGQGSKDTD